MAVFQASPSARFADDVALVRTLGGVPVGFEGQISAALATLFGLLPFGSVLLRTSFASACGVSLGSLFTYRLAQRILVRLSGASGASRVFALMAAASVTLGPSWIVEGSVPGGHALAAALALGALDCLAENRWPIARRALALGALLAATSIESRWTGLGTAFALLVALAFNRKWPEKVPAISFAVGALAVLVLPCAVRVSLALSQNQRLAFAFVGQGNFFHTLVRSEGGSAALRALLSQLGVAGLAFSAAGVLRAGMKRVIWPLFAPLLAFVGLELAVTPASTAATAHDAMSAVRLVALSALGIAGVLALSEATRWLRTARIAFARPASTLLVVYGFTLVLVSAESSTRQGELRDASAAEAWTDEALATLPTRSVLILRSEPVLWRLLASQMTRGVRPDVLLVPAELIERGGASAELFARHPGMKPLVRDLLLTGRPSEYALSALADERPTFVELDPTADLRLTQHLAPQAFFTAFAAQPLARSDRRAVLARAERPFRRIQALLRKANYGDDATQSIIEATLAQRALLLAVLGDREAATNANEELLAMNERSVLGLELKSRLEQNAKGRVDVSGLYASR